MHTRTRTNGAQKEGLEDGMSHILEEARMVLPGIQALLGFQLIAVFNSSFSDLPSFEQMLHLGAILCSLASIAILMTPAALHRQTEPKTVSPGLRVVCGTLVAYGMMPLIVSFTADWFVVSCLVTHSRLIAGVTSALVLLAFVTMWILFPRWFHRSIAPKTEYV